LKNQKNVLFIVIDQLRADCIFGSLAEKIQLPNINKLISDSTAFKAHYSVANPCGPSRASLLTGQYAMNHRSVRNGTPLSSNTINIAEQMRKLRYEPMLFGYTDTSLDPRSVHPNDPAIATYEQSMPGFSEKLEMRLEESYPWRSFIKQQGYSDRSYDDFYKPVQDPNGAKRIDAPAFYRAEHSDSAFLTDQTIQTLQVRTEQNWFAHVTYIRPHPPFVAPAPYNDMYATTDFEQAKVFNGNDSLDHSHPYLAIQQEMMESHEVVHGDFAKADKRDPEVARTMRSIYLGLITEVDHQVGRLIDFLKATDQYDSTLIVVTADHGEMLGDHGIWGKQTVYDKAIHIPLIMRDPQNTAAHGKQVNALTESVDIMPSILQWSGMDKLPNALNGYSLLPFLQGVTPKQWREHIFYELEFGEPAKPTLFQTRLDIELHKANVAILRENKYKLVHFNGSLAPLLFDLETDPEETINLAEDPKCASILVDMLQKMLNHRMDNADRSLSDMQVSSQGTINY
jgi:arylsulfatase A-like enzyme